MTADRSSRPDPASEGAVTKPPGKPKEKRRYIIRKFKVFHGFVIASGRLIAPFSDKEGPNTRTRPLWEVHSNGLSGDPYCNVRPRTSMMT